MLEVFHHSVCKPPSSQHATITSGLSGWVIFNKEAINGNVFVGRGSSVKNDHESPWSTSEDNCGGGEEHQSSVQTEPLGGITELHSQRMKSFYIHISNYGVHFRTHKTDMIHKIIMSFACPWLCPCWGLFLRCIGIKTKVSSTSPGSSYPVDCTSTYQGLDQFEFTPWRSRAST